MVVIVDGEITNKIFFLCLEEFVGWDGMVIGSMVVRKRLLASVDGCRGLFPGFGLQRPAKLFG